MPFKTPVITRGRISSDTDVSVGVRMAGVTPNRKPVAIVTLGQSIIERFKLKPQTACEIQVGFGKDLGKIRLVFGSRSPTVLVRKEAPESSSLIVQSIAIPIGDIQSARKLEGVSHAVVSPGVLEISLPWPVEEGDVLD